MSDAREFVELAAAVLVHVSDSLKAPHPTHSHHEWIGVVGDVGRLLEEAIGVDDDDEKADELMTELLAIAEAIDPKLTIERITSGKENDSEVELDDEDIEPTGEGT